LISPGLLLKEGFLKKEDLGKTPKFSKERCNYPAVIDFKTRLLAIASLVRLLQIAHSWKTRQ